MAKQPIWTRKSLSARPRPGSPEEPREAREPREAQSSENGGQNRKPRRRGRRGGRRGRGQRPEGGERQGEARGAPSEARDHGDAAHPEGEAHAQQNGNGRPVADTALHKERVERPARESEPTYAVPVTERPVAPPEIKVESETKEDSTPPRRGWWQR